MLVPGMRPPGAAPLRSPRTSLPPDTSALIASMVSEQVRLPLSPASPIEPAQPPTPRPAELQTLAHAMLASHPSTSGDIKTDSVSESALVEPLGRHRNNLRNATPAPLNRHGGFAVQSVPAIFPDIVAVRQVLMDGLTAVSYLHTCRTSDVPCLRPGAAPLPGFEPLTPGGAPWESRFGIRPV